jgi:hypothetical protein
MIKFSVSTLMCFVFLSFFSLAQAALIDNTNLTQGQLDARDYADAEDQLFEHLLGVNYITRDGYDWVWASSVNVENFDGQNTLHAPQLQKNWQFATGDFFDVLIDDLTIMDFTNGDGEYIHAAQFFNSNFDEIADTFSPFIFTLDFVSSEFYTFAFNDDEASYDTFYVRDSNLRPSLVVPEPTTLMIFTLGLIALVSKKRLLS